MSDDVLKLCFELDVSCVGGVSTWSLRSKLGERRSLLGRWIGDAYGLDVGAFEDMTAVALKKLSESFATAHIIAPRLFSD